MKKQYTRRQKAIIRRRIFICVCVAILIGLTAIIATFVNFIIGLSDKKDNNPVSSAPSSSVSSQVSEPEEEENKPPQIVSTATVLNIGDIMAHSTQLTGAYNSSSGEYDFSAFFKETKPIFEKADLVTANLEVTFGGKEAGEFRGYPSFNTPDSLADTIKDAGISLLLTSNNHSYDTGLAGLKRTARVLTEKGIEFTGTSETPNTKNYIIKEVNGIKIGIADFTYETTNAEGEAGRKYLNGIRLDTDANDLVNSFSYTNIDAFYKTAEEMISGMKEGGAEFITFHMHWGEEYQLSANTWQKSIAQKLSNLGVDMIVGGHPHVVQPIELIHSEGSDHTTICVYSLGNAVSNQRRELISSSPNGHTEDGLIFSYTLSKYSTGDVVLIAVDATPTWVNKYSGGGGYQYTIYPVTSETSAASDYGFSGANLDDTKQSFTRTKKIIGEGLRECQEHLGCEITFSE